MPPSMQYAQSGDVAIAYQVAGDDPIDVVLVLGFATHLELQWGFPAFARIFLLLESVIGSLGRPLATAAQQPIADRQAGRES